MTKAELMQRHRAKMAAKRERNRTITPGFTGMGWGKKYKAEHAAYIQRQMGVQS